MNVVVVIVTIVTVVILVFLPSDEAAKISKNDHFDDEYVIQLRTRDELVLKVNFSI